FSPLFPHLALLLALLLDKSGHAVELFPREDLSESFLVVCKDLAAPLVEAHQFSSEMPCRISIEIVRIIKIIELLAELVHATENLFHLSVGFSPHGFDLSGLLLGHSDLEARLLFFFIRLWTLCDDSGGGQR